MKSTRILKINVLDFKDIYRCQYLMKSTKQVANESDIPKIKL